jgi:hypothetical protein
MLPIGSATILYLITLVRPHWHLWPAVPDLMVIAMVWCTLAGSVMTVAALLWTPDRRTRLAVIFGIGDWVLLHAFSF